MTDGMYYLGVDPSLNAPGIAIVAPAGTVVVGTSLQTPKGLVGAARLRWLFEETQKVIRDYPVVAAAIEGLSVRSSHFEYALGEGSGIFKVVIQLTYGVEPYVVPPLVLKKFATENAQSDKRAVMRAVAQRWGFETTDDDAADAVVLAQMARFKSRKLRPETRAQAEALQQL